MVRWSCLVRCQLDARIHKLQEIRRLAADPEWLSMLLEFMEEERRDSLPPIKAAHMPAAPPPKAAHATSAPPPDDLDIVAQVVNGMDAKGGSPWSGKRG